MTIGEIRKSIRDRLQAAGIESADYETGILMEKYLHISREEFLLEPEKEIREEGVREVFAAAERRAGRIPLQQITGEAPFMGFTFSVNEHVLIPRMDTECLVEEAVREIRETHTDPVRVLDLCTGSGCIGISVALLCPGTEVVLSDLSDQALAVARRNADRLGAVVELVRGDLFESVEGRFDYILSNPPYIPSGDISGLMPEVRDHEPMLALDGQADGLAFYRKIIGRCSRYLKTGGRILFEIGAWQGKDVEKLLTDAGFSNVKTLKDLAGFDRVVRADLGKGQYSD